MPVTSPGQATPTRIPLTMQFSAHTSFYSSDNGDPKTHFASVRANVNIRIDNS